MNYLTPEFIEDLESSKEEDMLEALSQEFKSMFPSRTRVLGKENLDLFLTHQQERARHYNYIYYDDLKRYTIIAFYLGTYFDEDKLYPWVQTILKEDESFGVKVDSLMEKFQILSQQTMGKDYIYFLKALEKLEKLRVEHVESFRTFEDITNTLRRIYPQRVEAIGEAVLHSEVKVQKEELRRLEMSNPLGAFTYMTAKFMLGSHVLKDPLYAWVRKYVHKTYDNDKEKSRALFEKGKSRIRREIREINKMREEG